MLEHAQCLGAVVGQHLKALRGDFPAVLQAEELGAFDEVLDFAPVQLELRQPLQRFRVKVETVPSRALDEVLPDAVPRVAIEIRVRQEEIYPRPESMVNTGHSIRREEDGALVVL